jgi:hypothetical protein
MIPVRKTTRAGVPNPIAVVGAASVAAAPEPVATGCCAGGGHGLGRNRCGAHGLSGDRRDRDRLSRVCRLCRHRLAARSARAQHRAHVQQSLRAQVDEEGAARPREHDADLGEPLEESGDARERQDGPHEGPQRGSDRVHEPGAQAMRGEPQREERVRSRRQDEDRDRAQERDVLRPRHARASVCELPAQRVIQHLRLTARVRPARGLTQDAAHEPSGTAVIRSRP